MKICLLVLIYAFGLPVQAAEKVEFVANRIHSLLVFVNTISGDPHSPPATKELFEKSQYNNSESKKKIEQFGDLDNALERHISFGSIPKERKSALSIEKMIWTQAAFSENLNDLMQRILGMMRYDEQTQLLEILKYFEPIHHELLWKPYSQELEKTAILFQNKSKQWNLNDMFNKAVKFYDSKWPEGLKFRISLFPIPKGANQSTASSYGSFESVGIIMGTKDLESNFGVIFHELCHSLYDAQSTEFQNQISKWFQENKSPYSKMTYGWMNEAMATVLGNGWVYHKIMGKNEKKSWYNQPIIDGFAKALYPEVIKYLEANKSIDQKFIDTSIQVFQKTFPDSINDIGTLMTNLSFFTDGSFGRGMGKDLRGIYRIQSMRSSSPINHEESLGTLKEDSTSTVFIIAHWSNIKQFDSLKSDFPIISDYVNKAKKDKNLIGFFDHEGRKFIISLIKEDMGYEFIVQKLKTIKKIEKLNEFLDLDTI